MNPTSISPKNITPPIGTYSSPLQLPKNFKTKVVNTVFYSWQSDLPNNTNRGFIETCLEVAIKNVSNDVEIYEADRELELDKDTKGVTGCPEIVKTIFNKISAASAFIADVSYVAKSNGRSCPNPNVLIEYGWALNALTNIRVVPVMNTAFGNPKDEELPFDMKHLRWPFCYHLPVDASPADKKTEKVKLIKFLEEQIKGILLNGSKFDKEELFEPTPSTYQKSTFFDKGELLGSVKLPFGSGLDLPIYSDKHSYLRIYPKFKTEPISSLQETFNLSHELSPMGRATNGYNFGRNRFGSFTVQNDNEWIFSIIQLFQSKEIWAIDSFFLDPKNYQPQPQPFVGILDFRGYKMKVTGALRSYIKAYQESFKVEPPYVVEIGLVGIKDFRFFADKTGRYYNNEIERTYLFDGEEWTVEKILQDYFDYVEDQAG